jgi:hypothetical protein
MLVIGHSALDNISEDLRNTSTQLPSVCDVESLVFLSGTDPLTVIGMVVDTLGTVYNPYHLVIITNQQAVDSIKNELGRLSLEVPLSCVITKMASMMVPTTLMTR